MKILVIGGGGMLGHKLLQHLGKKHDVAVTIRDEFEKYKGFGFFQRDKTFEKVNIEDFKAVEKVVDDFNPQIIINAVGVIKQLPTAKNAVTTIRINSLFPHQLAELTREREIRLICVSTDCVFDGKRGDYTEADNPNATDLYGKSKNLGEVTAENCLTLRTSIIGRELFTAHSLIDWFLTNEGKTVKGFTNAIYTGFPTIVFAQIIEKIIEDFPNLNGLYQVASEPINKYELLKLVRDVYRANIEIEPFEDFYMDRSLNGEKFKSATGLDFPDWQTMIKSMAEDDDIYQKKL